MRRAAEPHQTLALALLHCGQAEQLQKASDKKSPWLSCEQHLHSPAAPGRLQVSCLPSDWSFFSTSSASRTISKQVHPKISLSRKCHCSSSTLEYSSMPSQTEEKSSVPKPSHIPCFTLLSPHRATASIRTTQQTVPLLKQEHRVCKQPRT